MKVAVIIGSVREGRKTPAQAKWVMKTLETMKAVEAELIDLQDYPMPIFNEPTSPRYNPERKLDPMTQKWLGKLAEFDAYVFVTPEYNHSVPGVLKNALDYVDWQLNRKPAAVVSHGSAGGARAEVALKEILSESRMVPMPTVPGVAMTHMSEKIDEDGNLAEAEKASPYGPQAALEMLLKELQWYSDALTPARAQPE
ncbi:MAG TPA: NAD(P)H-dependent oxidoreductase [Candidatus Saccharimonadales bacterium]|jgi:NAD(P)H-dependent FMN reductase|nr:NAD(P)H-dependent oxidoreductase [Candidatus Saccharimonadales bacterium]